MNQYYVIGIMSGTSLDGIDIALCRFEEKGKAWKYEIVKAKTYPYADAWRKSLTRSIGLNSFDFLKLHKEYGALIAQVINKFMRTTESRVDFVASHGHTIYHEPDKGITFQLGDGGVIASETGYTTISDFRSFDVALGGQGAPLVPVGDMLLFDEYDYCINFGGFANISFQKGKERVAFDISPMNTICNMLAQELDFDYDKDGKIGKDGELNYNLLQELNSLPYYSKPHPKSLSREWLESEFIPVLKKYPIRVESKLRTIYEHIAMQIAEITGDTAEKKILCTGGGALNRFLIKLIREKVTHQVIIPDKDLIQYKEAMIFGFLGVLRNLNEVNILSSVTGAKVDHSGGVIYKLK